MKTIRLCILALLHTWLLLACQAKEPLSPAAAPQKDGAQGVGTRIEVAAPVAPLPAATLVAIPGGEFMMGRAGDLAGTDDHWPHRVRVNSFRLAATELTNQEFADVYNWAISQKLVEVEGSDFGTVKLYDRKSARFLHTTWSPEAQVGELPRLQYRDGLISIDPDYGRHPVVRISWYAAVAYCKYRSMLEGVPLVFDDNLERFDLAKTGYRLPTEAEWEFAAREGGKELSYSWGEEDQVSGNIADRTYHRSYPQHPVWQDYNDGFVYTAPIASFRPNALGLFDMSGNAAEWCINWFYRYPGFENNAFLENPAGPDRNPGEGRFKTWRGGSWYDLGLKLVTTNRGWYSPDNAGSVSDTGFRLARSGLK